MRGLLAESGQSGGLDADVLLKTPLVFIWIPVGVILVFTAYCVCRCAVHRRTGPGAFQFTFPNFNHHTAYYTMKHLSNVLEKKKTDANCLRSLEQLLCDTTEVFHVNDYSTKIFSVAVSGDVKKVLFYPSQFETQVDRVPQPLDDDRPLPRRTLARISNSSQATALGTSETTIIKDHSGTMLGITHAQLQKLQLADIANMLLPDRTTSLHSISGGLPFVTAGSQGSASIAPGSDPPSDAGFNFNEIYHQETQSMKDLSAPIDRAMDQQTGSPNVGSRKAAFHSRNSLSFGDEDFTTAIGQTRDGWVTAQELEHQPQQQMPISPLGRKKRARSKSISLKSPVHAYDTNGDGRYSNAFDAQDSTYSRQARYGDDSENPVDMEL